MIQCVIPIWNGQSKKKPFRSLASFVIWNVAVTNMHDFSLQEHTDYWF